MSLVSSVADQKPASSLLQILRLPEPWVGAILCVSGFPIPEEELSLTRGLVQKIGGFLSQGEATSAHVFLQFNHLHHGDGPARLADNARQWQPKTGLGIWPDREPPTLWTSEDFQNIPIKGKPRPMMNKVFRLSAARDIVEKARDMMLGLGAVMEVVTSDGLNQYLKKTTALLQPRIKERALRTFPFYIPLLESRSLESVQADKLDEWLCGATAYVRESPEDSGILIISRKPLEPALRALGGAREASEENRWRIPA